MPIYLEIQYVCRSTHLHAENHLSIGLAALVGIKNEGQDGKGIQVENRDREKKELVQKSCKGQLKG